MKCSKCGKEIADDSVFCEYCGVKINLISVNNKISNKSKSNWVSVIGSLVATMCFFLCIFIIGEDMIGVIVGLIIGVPIFVYTIIKSYKIEISDNPNLTTLYLGRTSQIITQTVTLNNDSYKERIPYDKLNLTPIFLSPDSNFVYAGMREAVTNYLPKHHDALISVVYDKLGGNFISEKTVMQFLNYANFNDSNETSVALYFYPEYFSEVIYERFKKNPFIVDFTEKDPHIAEYGKDFNKAVKVASYILATVYYIPTDTLFEYDCASC